jgi:hypothetical protein
LDKNYYHLCKHSHNEDVYDEADKECNGCLHKIVHVGLSHLSLLTPAKGITVVTGMGLRGNAVKKRNP